MTIHCTQFGRAAAGLLLLLGLMAHTVATQGGPIRPRQNSTRQNAQARKTTGRMMPPPILVNRW